MSSLYSDPKLATPLASNTLNSVCIHHV